jgi:hypothetical protein
MSTRYLVTTKSAHGTKTSDARYATVDDALRIAKGLLECGAPSVWIINSSGDLILPADQVRLRLREISTEPQASAI